MNESIPKYIDKNIGIDPTTVEVIDVLELPEKKTSNEQKHNKPKKENNGGTFKYILFTIIILGLMGGVAYGIYFYLSIGNSRKNEFKPKFILNDINLYVGDQVATELSNYGDFDKIDLASCTLDTSGVDTTKEGTYEYYVTCDETKYNAKIYVMEKVIFTLDTKVAYANIFENIKVTNFVFSNESYLYKYENEEKVKNLFTSSNGLSKVNVMVNNEKGNETSVSGLLYITDIDNFEILSCKNEQITYDFIINETGDVTSSVVEKSTHIYSKNEYLEKVDSIKDGKIEIDNTSSYVLRNDVNNNLEQVRVISVSDLNIPNNKDEIKSHYENKGYECRKEN